MLVAELAVFLDGFVDDFFELWWDFGIEAGDRCGRTIENAIGDYAGGVAGKGGATGGHFVEDEAEGEEVGARVEFFATDLLGRHERDRANGGTGSGQQVFRSDRGQGGNAYTLWDTAGGSQFGQAEIE